MEQNPSKAIRHLTMFRPRTALEISLMCSQSLYHELDESSPHFPLYVFKVPIALSLSHMSLN